MSNGMLGRTAAGKLVDVLVNSDGSLVVGAGVAAADLGKAEDAVHASGDTGVMALAVRKDTAAAVAADGDYLPLIVDATGRMWAHIGAIDAGSAVIGKVSTDPTTPGTTDRVVAGKATVIDVTPVLDTSAYTANDCLFPEVAIANAVRASGLGATLCGVTLIDKDDEGAQVTLYFFDSDPDFGTANSAPNISDANAAKYLGKVDIATTDYVDLGGVKVAHIRGFALPLIPVGSTSLYVAATTTGTPTYTSASDIVLRFHLLQD